MVSRGFGWVRFLKALRASQPFNAVATRLARSTFGLSGRPPEWLVSHLHRVGNVTAPLPNGRTLRLWSRADDWISNQVFWRGWAGHEPETAGVFFRLAERSTAVVDVGAHVGYYSLLAAHANPSARVFAVEPLASVHSRLVRHVELNRARNVECVLAAAGATEGRALFYHVPTGLPTSSSLSFAFMERIDGVTATEVPVVVLDRFLQERGVSRVDLVKVDTESTEPDVLAGMAGVLKRDRPWIVCEVLANRGAEARLNALLKALDYRFFLLTPDGPQPSDTIQGHPTYLNYLFVGRAEAPPKGAS